MNKKNLTIVIAALLLGAFIFGAVGTTYAQETTPEVEEVLPEPTVTRRGFGYRSQIRVEEVKFALKKAKSLVSVLVMAPVMVKHLASVLVMEPVTLMATVSPINCDCVMAVAKASNMVWLKVKALV